MHSSLQNPGEDPSMSAPAYETATSEAPPTASVRPPRLLVAIASYGTRQIEYLKRVIRNYRQMSFDVDVVVVSEAPKDLGPDVRVVSGLPSANPWSLPFAHKKIFAENADRYDLFLYSEDDILVTEDNIRAFLRVTPSLAADEIAGFLHFEQDTQGKRWMVCVHRHFHWKSESAKSRGPHVVAEFSNEHSACYLLTRAQLKRAIASGGFLREPYEGVYDMLCTAATDPYTSSGFRKVICISSLDDFLVHHLPDKYLSELDVSLSDFRQQVQTLLQISRGYHPARSLCDIRARFRHFAWLKSYYEKPDVDLLSLIPAEAREILSIGCGWGALESKLEERGATVTALPLDSVIGEVAAQRGIRVLHGNWQECRAALNGRQFDCVIMVDLLHLHPNPGEFVGQCSNYVKEGGTLVLGGPNFDRVPWYVKRVCGLPEFRKLRRYDASGISVCGPANLNRPLRNAGLNVSEVRWLNHRFGGLPEFLRRLQLGRLTAKNWFLRARKSVAR